jgi:DNA-3-methyladenine glycosylase II
MVQAHGTLTATPPFDFNHSLHFLDQFGPAMGQQNIGGGVLTRAFSQAGVCIAFRVRSTGTITQPRLGYSLFSETELTDESRSDAADNIAFFLSLSDDLTPFYEIGRGDPAFAPIIQRLHGYHQVKFPTPFENDIMPNSIISISTL